MNLQSHTEKYLLHKTAKRSLFALICKINFKKISITIFRKTTGVGGNKKNKKINELKMLQLQFPQSTP